MRRGRTLGLHFGMTGRLVVDDDRADRAARVRQRTRRPGLGPAGHEVRGRRDVSASTTRDAGPGSTSIRRAPARSRLPRRSRRHLAAAFARRRVAVKTVLLDQAVVAGLRQHVRRRGAVAGRHLSARTGAGICRRRRSSGSSAVDATAPARDARPRWEPPRHDRSRRSSGGPAVSTRRCPAATRPRSVAVPRCGALSTRACRRPTDVAAFRGVSWQTGPRGDGEPFLNRARTDAGGVGRTVGDPEGTRTVTSIIALLVALGLALVMLAVWLHRDHPARPRAARAARGDGRTASGVEPTRWAAPSARRVRPGVRCRSAQRRATAIDEAFDAGPRRRDSTTSARDADLGRRRSTERRPIVRLATRPT